MVVNRDQNRISERTQFPSNRIRRFPKKTTEKVDLFSKLSLILFHNDKFWWINSNHTIHSSHSNMHMLTMDIDKRGSKWCCALLMPLAIC